MIPKNKERKLIGKPLASLAAWAAPAHRQARRVIALVMAASFLLPGLTWAFEVESYQSAAAADSAPLLTIPGFSIPQEAGKVIAASVTSGAPTLVLIQDLHCNFEVQANIRQILLSLRSQHPDLRLIGVEGATGLVPTRKLAAQPATRGKHAVITYFMHEGKLTGADYLAICDRAQVEIFGAEDADLYARSLKLVEQFGTEENIGRVLELGEQVNFLRGREYNQALLLFERRREAAVQGRIDPLAYHAGLLKDARRLGLAPAGAEAADLQERFIIDRELEQKLRERLFVTDRERRLFAYQRLLELAEHILSVSASPEEVREYQALSRQGTLAELQAGIQPSLVALGYYTGVQPRLAEEIAGLQGMVDQGLGFYQLAEARNQALFQRLTARMQARRDRIAVLIAGGFHTRAIGDLARGQGYSVVGIRPRQVRLEQTSNYLQLLHHPDQPTTLERLLVRMPARSSAIAPPYGLVQLQAILSSPLPNTFLSTILNVLDERRSEEVANIRIAWTANNVAVITEAGTDTRVYAYRDSAGNVLFAQDQETALRLARSGGVLSAAWQRAGEALRQRPVLIVGLAVGAVALTAAVLIFSAPAAGAFAALGAITITSDMALLGLQAAMGASVLLIAGWGIAAAMGKARPLPRWAPVVAGVFIAALFLVGTTGPVFAEGLTHATATSASQFSLTHAALGAVQPVVQGLGLTVHSQTPVIGQQVLSTALASAPVMANSLGLALGMVSTVVTTNLATGYTSFTQLVAAKASKLLIYTDVIKNGRPAQPGETAEDVASGHDVVEVRKLERSWRAFERLGLGTLMPENVGDDPAVLSQHQATLDRYVRTALLPGDGVPFETPIFSKIYQNVHDNVRNGIVYLLHSVIITTWQFFGSNDFVPGDFQLAEMKVQLAAPVDSRRKADRLVLEQLGIASDASTAVVLARIGDMEKAGTFETRILAAVNTLMGQTDLAVRIDRDYTKAEDARALDLSETYPEVANLIQHTRFNLARAAQAQGAGLSDQETRGVNRALFEMLYPQAQRVSRPTSEVIAAKVRQGLVNAYDAFATWDYFKKQPDMGILVLGGNGQPITLKVAEGSWLSKADPQFQNFLLNVFYQSAKKHKTSAFFQRLKTDPAFADEYIRAIIAEAGMHELAHKTVQLLPDEKEADASIPAVERTRQKEFSQQRWKQIALKLAGDNGVLQASLAASKDGFKAVMDEDNADDISDDFALELFCDRFGMYADQTDREIDVYYGTLAQVPGYNGLRPTRAEEKHALEAAGVMLLLERFGLTAEEKAELERRLHEVNPGRAKLILGDPLVNTQELAVYQDVLAPHYNQMGTLFPRDAAGMLALRDAGRTAYLLANGAGQTAADAVSAGLAAAAQASFFIRAGDAPLTLEELYFFRKAAEYVAYFADKGEGGLITKKHSASPYARLSREGAVDFGVSAVPTAAPGLAPLAKTIVDLAVAAVTPPAEQVPVPASAPTAMEMLADVPAAAAAVEADEFGEDVTVEVAAAPMSEQAQPVAEANEAGIAQLAVGISVTTGGTPAGVVAQEIADEFGEGPVQVETAAAKEAPVRTAAMASSTGNNFTDREARIGNMSSTQRSSTVATQTQSNPASAARDQAPQITVPTLAARAAQQAEVQPAAGTQQQSSLPLRMQTQQAGDIYFGLVDGWQNSPAPPPNPLVFVVAPEMLPLLAGAWNAENTQVIGADQTLPQQGTVITLLPTSGANPVLLVRYPGATGGVGTVAPYLAIQRPDALSDFDGSSQANVNRLAPSERAAMSGLLIFTPAEWAEAQSVLGNYTPVPVQAVTMLSSGAEQDFYAQAQARMVLLMAAAADVQVQNQFGANLQLLQQQLNQHDLPSVIGSLVGMHQAAAAMTGTQGVTGFLAALDQQYQQILAIQAAQAWAQGRADGLQTGVQEAFGAGALAVTMQFDFEQLGKVRSAAAALPANGVGVVMGDPTLTSVEAARNLDLLRAELAKLGFSARVVWPSVQAETAARKQVRAGESADAAVIAAGTTPRLEFARKDASLPGDSVAIPAQRIWQTSSRRRSELFRMPGLQGELEPLPDQTDFTQSTGVVRRVMRAALFFAEFLFLMRAMGGNLKVVWASRFRNGELPIVSMFSDSSFLNALRIMSILLFGRVGDLERTVDSALAAQLQQLLPNLREQMRDLGAVRSKLEAFENARRANSRERFNFDDPSLPRSLRYSLRQLVWLMTILQDVPVLSAAMRRLDIRLTTMLPELLVVVNAFALMENVNWRISPTAYMDREVHVVLAGSLSPQLVKDLDGSKRYKAMLANLESGVNANRLVRLALHMFRLLARHNGNTAEDQGYRESVLRLISILSPNDRRLVELRGLDGDRPIRTLIYLPNILFNDPKLLDHVLTILEQTPEGFILMDQNNQVIEHPARVERFGGSA